MTCSARKFQESQRNAAVGFFKKPSILHIMKLPITIKEALILAAAAALLAVVINALSPVGIPLTGKVDVSASAADSPFSTIDVSDARRLVDAGEVVFVDARPVVQYEAGHIPGARSLPVYQIDDYLPQFLDAVQADAPIVVYCSSLTCEDSHLLAQEFADMGYGDVRIFAGGMEAWREKGYAVASK